MRKVYLVTYDICDPRRLRKVFKTMCDYGDHLQYSVFRCELSQRTLVELGADLHGIIHHEEDQILFVNLGPADGRGRTAITALGRPYAPVQRQTVVV